MTRLSVVKVDNETDGTGLLLDSKGLVALVVGGVGIEEAEETLTDVRALITGVVTDTHTLDVEVVELSNDAGNIIAGVSVVLGVAHVEFTPGGGVLSEVGGGDLTLSGSPATLRVVIDGDVLDSTLGERELQSGVGRPETIHLAVGAIGVPEEDVVGLIMSTLETDDVLVRAGISLVDENDVATPRNADIALVAPVLFTAV